MKQSIGETERRRKVQEIHNRENGITPEGIQKAIHDITERVREISEPETGELITSKDLPKKI